MVCKCGARVKASAHRAQITRFGALSWALGRNAPAPRGMTSLAGLPGGRKPAWSGQLILPAVRPVQELGTIEARACVEVARACRAARSPARSNSIRRSNAVDRIIG